MNRPFTSIYDFCSNVDTRLVNKRALEGLVLSGAFDNVKGSRAQNMAAIENALQFGGKVQNASSNQGESLFGEEEEAFMIEEPELPDIEPWEPKESLAREREVLGFYLSDHPLRKYQNEYDSFASVHLGEPETYKVDETVRTCGVITEVRTKIDKSGRQMAFFKLDDFSGSCEGLMFSKIYAECQDILIEEATVLITGRLESSGDTVKLHAEEVMPLEEVKQKLTKKIAFIFNEQDHSSETIEKLKNILEEHTGPMQAYARVRENGGYRNFYLDFKISLSDDFLAKTIELLGEDNIQYIS